MRDPRIAPVRDVPSDAAPERRESERPEYVFVPELPDLIMPEEYGDYPEGRLVRIRISVTAEGVVILGDSFRPALVEHIMAAIGGGPIEQMLCG